VERQKLVMRFVSLTKTDRETLLFWDAFLIGIPYRIFGNSNTLLGLLELLDLLDSLGLVSNLCNHFSSSPDWFPRSNTSTQLTDFIIT